MLLRWPMGRSAHARWLAWQGVASCIGRGDGHGSIMFNTGHTGIEDDCIERVVRWHRVRPVFMLHDLIPITHPQFCRPGEAERHELRVRNMLRLGAGIVLNSQSTLGELSRFAQGHGLRVPPTLVAPLAPALLRGAAVDSAPELARPASDLLPAQPYFVALGTVEPRKNHAILLQVWQQLVAIRGERAPHLVIVGQRGWQSEHVEGLLERGEGFGGRVTALRDCSDERLGELLDGACALLFPSFVEGYGLPVVEALAAGTPVIASRLPVLREIAGDVPDYLDPHDSAAWLARVQDYAGADSPARAAQRVRMDGFAPATWQEHFERVDRFVATIDADR
ncbi:MAG: glycosyltransferase family 1 protein [Caldimonas sp.]